METILPYALTTLQRVKDRLFDPNLTIACTGNTTNTSTSVTSLTVPQGKILRVGQVITGVGVPVGTTISSFTPTTLTLSQAATANGTTVALTVIDQPTAFDAVLTRMINSVTEYVQNECGRHFVKKTYTNEVYSVNTPRQIYLMLRNFPVVSLSSFQWRAGTPSNPNWMDFIPDQYELVDPEPMQGADTLWYPKGKIRVYGVLPRLYNNMLRATYVAGYAVDWPNAGNATTHLLPSDITDLCENLVLRRFSRRQLAGKSSQGLEGATTSWKSEIDAEDLDIIGQYRTPPTNW